MKTMEDVGSGLLRVVPEAPVEPVMPSDFVLRAFAEDTGGFDGADAESVRRVYADLFEGRP